MRRYQKNELDRSIAYFPTAVARWNPDRVFTDEELHRAVFILEQNGNLVNYVARDLGALEGGPLEGAPQVEFSDSARTVVALLLPYASQPFVPIDYSNDNADREAQKHHYWNGETSRVIINVIGWQALFPQDFTAFKVDFGDMAKEALSVFTGTGRITVPPVTDKYHYESVKHVADIYKEGGIDAIREGVLCNATEIMTMNWYFGSIRIHIILRECLRYEVRKGEVG